MDETFETCKKYSTEIILNKDILHAANILNDSYFIKLITSIFNLEDMATITIDRDSYIAILNSNIGDTILIESYKYHLDMVDALNTSNIITAEVFNVKFVSKEK